jgi:hypothetical protein
VVGAACTAAAGELTIALCKYRPILARESE